MNNKDCKVFSMPPPEGEEATPFNSPNVVLLSDYSKLERDINERDERIKELEHMLKTVTHRFDTFWRMCCTDEATAEIQRQYTAMMEEK